MIRTILLFTFICISHGLLFAQNEKTFVDETLEPAENKAHMEFLASDALRGRDTGSQGLQAAARYLVEQMQKYGVKPVEGAVNGYLQPVPLRRLKKPDIQTFEWISSGIELPGNTLVFKGENGSWKGQAVFKINGNYVRGVDQQPKIAFIKSNSRGLQQNNIQEWLQRSENLYKHIANSDNNVQAIIEIYSEKKLDGSRFKQQLSGTRMVLDTTKKSSADQKIPHLIVLNPGDEWLQQAKKAENKPVALKLSGGIDELIESNNVIGMIEGTDPDLKNEFILLTAHYDHIGISQGIEAGRDSINNGARDNGIGMVALLNAARHVNRYPLKRSVLFLYLTAEEKGLLGSNWYANHPLVPLNKTIFNLNIDGAGYNDTTKVVVVGLNKTSARDHFITAARAYNLKAVSSPEPQLRLFYRSDNINFARKGVPAPTFTQGFTGFDQTIQKYYHQPADEAQSLHYSYLNRYYQAFTLALRLIGNDDKQPVWLEGEEFKAAYETLYR